MIPIRDHNPAHATAWVTLALIAVNVVMFFLEPLTEPDAVQNRYFACNAAIPYEVMSGETVAEGFDDGEVSSPLAPAVADAQQAACPDKSVWGSIFRSMFLHGGFFHIIGNMVFLWVFGNNVEDRLGRVKYIIFYFAAGIAATYAQSAVNPGSAVPLIGASGAVAGVLGAYILMFPKARVVNLVILGFIITTIELPAVVVLGLWFLLQVFQGFGSVAGDVGGVAYLAHVGGFVAGMLLLLILRPRRATPGPISPWHRD